MTAAALSGVALELAAAMHAVTFSMSKCSRVRAKIKKGTSCSSVEARHGCEEVLFSPICIYKRYFRYLYQLLTITTLQQNYLKYMFTVGKDFSVYGYNHLKYMFTAL
jgi:hypothetical protein